MQQLFYLVIKYLQLLVQYDKATKRTWPTLFFVNILIVKRGCRLMTALLIVSTALSIIVFNPMNAFHSNIGSLLWFFSFTHLIRAAMYYCFYIESHHLTLLQLTGSLRFPKHSWCRRNPTSMVSPRMENPTERVRLLLKNQLSPPPLCACNVTTIACGKSSLVTD